MSSKGKGSWRTPLLLVVIYGAAVAIVYGIDLPLRAGVAMGAGALLLALLILWLLLRAPVSSKVRLRSALVAIGFIGVLAASVRMEGSADGTSRPNFVWKWSPKKGAGIDALPTSVKAVTSSTAVPHRDVTQFLGDDARSGIFPAIGLGDGEAKEVWRIPVGLGWGGFSVAGDRALTLEQRGNEELLSCYDLGTGAFLWAHRNTTRFSESLGGDGPRSTPTIDAEAGLVYSMGATGTLDCVKLDDGKLVWTQNVLSGGGGMPTYGKPCSPLLSGELVVVSGGTGAPTLLAYRRDDGTPVWTAGDSGSSYSSPALLDIHGVQQIVSVNSDNVSGHDPVSGKVQWVYPWEAKWPKSAQPRSVGDGRILLTASYGMGTHLIEVKGGEAEEVWRNIRMKTKFSSVCVKDGYAYGLDEGVFSCIEIASGDRIWKDGRYGFGQNILAGDILIVQAEDGEVVLVEATPEEHREIRKFEALDGKTWNTPTLAEPYLLLRNDTEAVCLLLPVEVKK